MGWVSPTGFVDGGGTWASETLAYDEDTGTYAYEDIGAAGWGNYLELTHSAIDCDKVQIWSGRSTGNITDIEVDVYYDSAWHNIYSGPGTFDAWVEYPVGSTQSISALRARYYTDKKSRQARIHEADFNEFEAAAYYHGLKVQGEGELALCDVGNHPLRFRKGGTTYGIELVATDDPNASRIRIKTPTGIKAIRKYT